MSILSISSLYVFFYYVRTQTCLIGNPLFCDPAPFLVLRLVQVFGFFLDALHFNDMRASDRVSTVRDCHNVLGDTDVGEWVKHLVALRRA